MKKLIILLAAAAVFTSCTKSENLNICLANGYDQTIIVSGCGEDFSIKPGKLLIIATCFAQGDNYTLDPPELWHTFFYTKCESLTIYAEDKTVLDTWTKDDTRQGNPFDIANWSNEEKVESGVDGGPMEGLQYTFLVSAYTHTKRNLTYVIAP